MFERVKKINRESPGSWILFLIPVLFVLLAWSMDAKSVVADVDGSYKERILTLEKRQAKALEEIAKELKKIRTGM
jgi:hypothetical protein